jgi:hypothetical protein
VLGDDEVGFADAGGVAPAGVFAVDEDDGVGVALEGSGVAGR